jgi:2-succinyl-5-enolpyruvyl-6-hydroxy-3-cyclohexene-1-carboxylate synthase
MTEADPADVQAAFCAVVVDEWARAGVTDAVVAPGSRSTPLVLALDGDRRIRVHVVLDERSAGFTALGLGLATGRPAVVATTSGTASVEIHPAVVEAFQAGVPLIAATTDRPAELHHVGAPQTVEQEDLFAGTVRWRVNPGVADLAAAASWRSLASRCVAEARRGASGPGPVHINLAFREPLIGCPDHVSVPSGRPGGQPWHAPRREGPGTDGNEDVMELLRTHAGGRGVIIAGQGAARSAAEAASLLEAAYRLGWPVLAEPRSGCRIPDGSVVAAADAILRLPEVAGWSPDLVLTLGAPWASKVVNQWLAALPPTCPQILVDTWGRWLDPDRRASHVVAADPAILLSATGAQLAPPDEISDWSRGWVTAEAAAQGVFSDVLGQRGELRLSEPAVARSVFAAMPEDGRLLVSSSMPVRDVEWFSCPRPVGPVLSNRGANGIDGVLSTAIGVALSGGPTVALLGDLAFLYDAGALLGAAGRPMSLTVVVVDNDGGGIFSFLPQATAVEAERFETYWGTPHGVDLLALTRAYGVHATAIDDRGSLDALLARSHQPGVRVGVVRSNRIANVEAHGLLNSLVAAAVRAALAQVGAKGGPGRPGGPAV